MTHRENILRTVRFEKPERIPVSFGIGGACWETYPQDALKDLMANHPLLFPNFQKSDAKVVPTHAPWRQADRLHTDSWGCVWQTAQNGITGTVIEHALPAWQALSSYVPPSPDEHDGWGRIGWEDIRERVERQKTAGRLAAGKLRHGHTFMTLMYIRGYQNLLFDMVDARPEIAQLIEMVEQFNLGLVQRYLELGVEWMGYPEDLGMQQGPMLSPDHFKAYIKPTYKRLVAPAKEAGCVIHMHSDGDIRELCEDLLDVGMDVINLQDLVNGIGWMKANLKGRVCVELDLDRQNITRFGTPDQIDRHVREAVKTLGSPEGGLMLKHGLYPGVPLENVAALMTAMETYSTYYS